MKAFVLAAGLGTRLKPWTLHHPKALVPVGGVPMLERVVRKLESEGFDSITVNIHHFARQIADFVSEKGFPVQIMFSDESDRLLDTGGGLLKASKSLAADQEPFLVHNVDILSDAPLAELMRLHKESDRDISLVTSPRESSRKLVFDADGTLRGWKNLKTGECRPEGFRPGNGMHERAFSGIYFVNPEVFDALREYSRFIGSPAFPVMDFFMHNAAMPDGHKDKIKIGEIELEQLNLIDIGKPETLGKADSLLAWTGQCR